MTTNASPAPLSVCFVSTSSALDNGGTAAYIRYLGNHLRPSCPVSAVARHVYAPQVLAYEKSDTEQTVPSGEDWQTQIIAPKSYLRPALASTLRLITRPALQNAGVKGFQNAYDGSVDAGMPHSVNAVHYVGNGWELLGFSALAAARKRGAAFVVTPFVHPGAWGDSPLDIRLYNEADAVLVCSQYEANYLSEKGVAPSQMRQIGLAPASQLEGDGARFRQRYELQERPLVLFIGRKQKYKGYHALRSAINEVQKAVPDVCLVAAGSDLEPPYPSVAPENLLDLGELKVSQTDQQNKADALAACTVFAMPSEAEAFGIVYVEAWANAKPVIGGTAPAVRELVEEGVTGFCSDQNPADLARVITRLLQDPEMTKRMGAAGYARQQKAFTWEAVAAHHAEIYRSLLQASLGKKAR